MRSVGFLSSRMKTGFIFEEDFKSNDVIGRFRGGRFQILGHDGEIGVRGEEGVQEFVISPMEVTLNRIWGNNLKLADHFFWPRHVGGKGRRDMNTPLCAVDDNWHRWRPIRQMRATGPVGARTVSPQLVNQWAQRFLYTGCLVQSQVYTVCFFVPLLQQSCIIERRHATFDPFGGLPSVRPPLLSADFKSQLWDLLRKHSSKGGSAYGN